MAGNKSTGRDYTKDTAYESSPEQIKKRELRNAARRQLEAQGKVSKGDDKDVDHIHMLKNSSHPTKSFNQAENLRAIDETKNRGWRKGKHGY